MFEKEMLNITCEILKSLLKEINSIADECVAMKDNIKTLIDEYNNIIKRLENDTNAIH